MNENAMTSVKASNPTLAASANTSSARVIDTGKGLPRDGAGRNQYALTDKAVVLIFTLLAVIAVVMIIVTSIETACNAINASLFGIFKRPVAANPALYFDVNCINTMKLEDFMDPNQVQRCRALRPINRLGPALGPWAPK